MTRPKWFRHALTLVVVSAVFLLHRPIEGWAGVGASPILYLPLVTLAAWYGGFGAGVAAVLSWGLLWVYFEIPPYRSLGVPSPSDQFRVVVFLGEGLLLTAIIEMLRTARRTSEVNAREAERYRMASGRNEAQLRAILENSPAPIFLKDIQGRYLLVNRPFEELASRRGADVVGLTDSELFLPRIAGPLQDNDRAVIEQGRSIEAEEVLLLDGEPRTFLSVKFPLVDARGEIYAMGGIYTDITARKQAERRLRDSEERFRALGSCSPVGIFLTDINGQTTYINNRCREIFGIDHDADPTLGWLSKIHPEDVTRVRSAWDECREMGRVYSEEYRATGPDGGDRWVHDRTAPLLADRGSLIGHVGTVEEITERKAAEAAIRQERDFAESLIEAAQVIVLVLDPDGRVARVNRFLEQVTGFSPDEVRGADWFGQFVPTRDQARAVEAFGRANEVAGGSQVGHAILDREGREREVEWAHRPLLDPADPSRRRVLAIGHDITALKQAQRRAVQAERLAAIGQMVTGLAHESRNALQRSQACLEMLSFRIEDRPEAVDLVSGIQDAQDDLQRLYEEVRSYAAPIHLDRRPWPVGALLEEAWDQLELTRRSREVGRVDLGGPGPDCLVDRRRMVQVFRNVLDNALAACHDPVEIVARACPADVGGRAGVRVSIRDNGPGLDPEQRRGLFEPFFTTKTQGTGLGMAIARRIVEAHDGSISLGTGEGPGAEIIITLPRGLDL